MCNCFSKNLGLGAGAPPIGIPFFWPLSAMPNTVMTEWSGMVFLKLNDATFSATTYPKLALVWPELKLTDTRGEFIRIWDDGRGVDSGRALLSYQGDAIRNITGTITPRSNNQESGSFLSMAGGDGVLYVTGTATPTREYTVGTTITSRTGIGIDASRLVPTASENRPRNIAFNFLVRAK
ncbi:phage tail protein [Escherichia coli]|nr:phage tail protein [Escherichia coli]MBA1671309.1 phage tail protein [Escherichia coli]NYZ42414.1 phage tail protein [Escherichia coli]